MADEELRAKAREWIDGRIPRLSGEAAWGNGLERDSAYYAYIAGAKSRDELLARLRAALKAVLVDGNHEGLLKQALSTAQFSEPEYNDAAAALLAALDALTPGDLDP